MYSIFSDILLCREWLKKLYTSDQQDTKLRNDYLAKLWEQLKNGELKEPFDKLPQDNEPLVPLTTVRKVNDEIHSDAGDEVHQEIRNEVHQEACNVVHQEAGDEIDKKVCDEINKEVGDEIHKEIKDELYQEVSDEMLQVYQSHKINQINQSIQVSKYYTFEILFHKTIISLWC